MTTTSAAAVLTRELARHPDPTARRLLRALRTAGFEVKPAARGPAWMPTTPDAYALVKQAADLDVAGLNRHEIAGRMSKDKRTIDRYLAAAREMTLLAPTAPEQP
ncbi:hypothetical protein FAF44_02810 [Nonomuraea sp. MG754425]|uniref:hypothetical protein n=1 Tax=Nonomuraea sp. MG754425 TaxID=2570319 RepID=UPI001F290184|nr:hypothetical protein [Nonomuraea sp. MG754425]MCF6467345.1 hypothetical protein [Nonomuraea sp. MG754425]